MAASVFATPQSLDFYPSHRWVHTFPVCHRRVHTPSCHRRMHTSPVCCRRVHTPCHRRVHTSPVCYRRVHTPSCHKRVYTFPVCYRRLHTPSCHMRVHTHPGVYMQRVCSNVHLWAKRKVRYTHPLVSQEGTYTLVIYLCVVMCATVVIPSSLELNKKNSSVCQFIFIFVEFSDGIVVRYFLPLQVNMKFSLLTMVMWSWWNVPRCCHFIPHWLRYSGSLWH